MIKNFLLKTVNKYVKEYFENINDIEYGLFKGEVKMKDTFFKENALNKFTTLLLKNSKIEEIDAKYNWSLFGEGSVHIKLHHVIMNLHPGGLIDSSIDNTSALDIGNININMEINNLVVNFDDVTLKISNLTFYTTEFFHHKTMKLKGIAIYLSNKKIFYIPTFEGDINIKEVITLNTFIRIIYMKIDFNLLTVLLNYNKYLPSGVERQKGRNIKLISNIQSIIIDFTDVRKKIYFDTTSVIFNNKFGLWIERVSGFDVQYKSRFISRLKHFRPKKILDIVKFSFDKQNYTFERMFFDFKLINLFLNSRYYGIRHLYKVSRTDFNENLTLIIKSLRIIIDGTEATLSNCLFKTCVCSGLYRSKLCVDSLFLDDFLKAKSLRIGYKDKKLYSEVVDIFLNLEELNLKKTYRLYLKYFTGDDSLDIDFENHLSNFKIVYGPKTKLLEMDNIYVSYKALDYTLITPLLSVSSDSGCLFEVFKIKNNLIYCLTDLFLDLKILKKFNNDFILAREKDINCIIKHFKNINKKNGYPINVYLYNMNIVYENLRLNIEFLDYNLIINTIFTVFLDDGDHIIVDSAKVKIHMESILQIQIIHNLRINITNNILKNINRFFSDIKNSIILSIKDNEDNIPSICWILDVESISVNVFDINLNEIAAIYLLKTKICNVKEHDGDETVRKLYLKINNIQIDNQIMKNTYPVLLYKTKSNDIIEGNVLYYYNNSTLFIKKTDVKFEEMRLNIEGKHLNDLLEVLKVDSVGYASLDTNIESFMNTCVTVKDFHIGCLNVKINHLMKSGDNFRDKMLFFVMNNISDFNLSIDKLNINHHRTNMKGLLEIVYDFYKNEIYNNLFKIVGHIDLLGNVGTLTNTISRTIKENVKKKTGFLKGSKILLKNTLFGVTNTLGKISSSVKNNVGLLTFDKEFTDASEYHPYAYDMNLPLPFKQSGNQLNLIMKGTEKLISSLYSGMLGVAKKPYDGLGNGVGGVIVGLGKGMIGAISKPVVGASELLSNCVQCMGGELEVTRRIMYAMYTVDKIGKYDLDQAFSYYIFCSFLNKMEGEEFLDGSFGYFCGECLLILTNMRLIISTNSSIFEFDPYEIHIDSRDMNRFVIYKEEVIVYKRSFMKKLCEFLIMI